MSYLHNRISHKELKQQLLSEQETRITISFYQYFFIEDPLLLRNEWFQSLTELNVFGRIYMAQEGINAQISVPKTNFEKLRTYIYSHSQLNNIRLNIAVDDNGKSFWVLKIKVREKIVTDGIADPEFDMRNKGKYVNAEEFNAITQDPETIVVDMRNHYEYEVGHFENAIEIPSDTFRDQLPMAVEMLQDKKDANIIMYCTGGIRCEKASAWMLHKGFKNVFHLEGGVIHYSNTIKEKNIDNKFIGKNFVFDDRLGERISDAVISKCHQCGKPSDTHTNCVNPACHLLFIQCEECAKIYEGCCGIECNTVIHLPEEEQIIIRRGIDKGRNIFNKSKARLRPKLFPPSN
ncbi:MAG: rhodanese-related sulfurtransferase [Bacteroidetes bacterium]|nr:rhodanese-related sulfurtransferase [Bacteroidota bacterium]MBP7400915.1 rhodanese-related sulfurtransferase [Chitinophagales bacterium]MBK7107609.1 rhodanese-related sulfurtransferase [Bacteroidota bacterium]MBK8486984.1 rhodanese-related sulfurtransferase [Bacteroidota bacterium]MBK8680353.1 rhodanese-related sulfurtransferase [Bacteroidota bacterium]